MDPPYPPILTTLKRIANWFKEERKKQNHAALPYADSKPRVLNLSGKSKRKKPPYQLYQAYSILHWRPKDSPLRQEVEDLWARRNESSVQEVLKPFFKDTVKASTSTSPKLLFHIAVMRWKCSLMAPDELLVLQDWIQEQTMSKEAERAFPWLTEAAEHGDALFAENTYVQRYVLRDFVSSQCLTLYLSVLLMTSHPQCKWLSRRLSDRPVGRLWSSLEASNPRGGQFPVICKSPDCLHSPHCPYFYNRYTTGKSSVTGLEFHEAHPEVAHVRTMFNEWLRTVYSRCSATVDDPSLTLFPSIPLGDEEKKKRSLQGALSFLSLAAPHPMDTVGLTVDIMDSSNGAPPSNDISSPMDQSLPPPIGVGNLQSPNPPPQPPSAMNSDYDIPPSNDDLGSMSPPPSPVNASDSQRLNSPPPPPIEADSVGPSNIADFARALGVVSRTSSPFLVNPAANSPSQLSQSTNLPGDTPSTPRSNVPTSVTTLPYPPLTSAGNGAFNLTGVLGDFISESIRAYWESVPGGEKWVAMVKSYLILQTILPSRDVRASSNFVLTFVTLIPHSSNFSDFQQHLDHNNYKPG